MGDAHDRLWLSQQAYRAAIRVGVAKTRTVTTFATPGVQKGQQEELGRAKDPVSVLRFICCLTRLTTNCRIAFTLLNVPPFSRYSLQVRCFDQRAYNLYCSHGGIAILDLKGVSSLDIADERLEEVVEAWVDREDVCDLCDKPTEVSLSKK